VLHKEDERKDIMADYRESINKHYGRVELHAIILQAFNKEGIETDDLTLDDLARIDQLHTGGRGATRVLAELAGLLPGMKVLDIGSGLGGPARTLAAEYGCTVIGLDITEEFVKTAQLLNKVVGLSESVDFREGNALDLEFEHGEFDVVWTQNAIMNIENKDRFFREAHRVLRSDGLLALEAFMAGPNEAPHYPVYWADSPNVSFLSTSNSFRHMMTDVGFEELVWKDVTQKALERGRWRPADSGAATNTIGPHILFSDVSLKAENTRKGLEDGSFVDIYAVYRRAT
jgi:cyclopropane fatty-acyl-phospholipid synthase-like methyltransferase